MYNEKRKSDRPPITPEKAAKKILESVEFYCLSLRGIYSVEIIPTSME